MHTKKITLKELKWLTQFSTHAGGSIYTKSALCMGSKIGCYNAQNELIWLEGASHVIFIKDF